MSQRRCQVSVQKIVSGGQTGVDRAALDAAIELGIPHGGWCPQGRIAEDGVIPTEYRLCEVESVDYPIRTERNIADSDGTLILFRGRLFGGTDLTRRLARKLEKPHLLIDLTGNPDTAPVHRWLCENRIQVLNVAGPRESNCPGIHDAALAFLRLFFGVTARR